MLAVVTNEVRCQSCCEVGQGSPVNISGMRAGQSHPSLVSMETDSATSRTDPGEHWLSADVEEVTVFTELWTPASELVGARNVHQA